MSAKIISHNFTGRSLVVVHSNGHGVKTEVVQDSHPQWEAVMKLYKRGKYVEMLPLLDVSNAITIKSGGKFVVKNGKVFYNGQETHGYLFDRILLFMREFPKQYPRLIRFAENLYKNTDENVRKDLYKFLEHGGNPITEDGCFLAYKGVRKDYYSITAGKIKLIKGKTDSEGRIYNGIREEIIAEKDDVVNDPNQGCAQGIHAGSHQYADGFKSDGRLIIVKINPRDVVSVPNDENYQKLRTYRYVVIAEEGRKLDEKMDIHFDKIARANYHNQRGSDGKFATKAKQKAVPAVKTNKVETERAPKKKMFSFFRKNK